MRRQALYNFAFFDEGSKRELRRAILKAVAIPGYQVPFASREMPIARGWGTGGLQLTLSLVGRDDVLKVIDQGADESVNAVSIKRLVKGTTGIETTEDARKATIIQSRHRIPEIPLARGQILVLQVPMPEPLRFVEPSEYATKRLHAEKEYSGAYLALFEEIMKYGRVSTGADHPVMANDRYVMAPSPIPRFDNPKMDRSRALILLGAGREKKIYAVPPFTKVASLDFEDYPFEVEAVAGRRCRRCGAEGVFMDEIIDDATGAAEYQCNDSSYCAARIGASAGTS
jgi:alpha-D-ribose 1-methylphosphonate 5-phosphate C-P lyase